jgi:hypothetical protein
MSLFQIIADWQSWLRNKRAERVIAAAERERQAIARAKERRRQKHQAFRHLDGDLRRATCRSLAASCGRNWEKA